MFEVGTLVTGKVRTYERSIYRVADCMDARRGKFEFIALSGRTQAILRQCGYKEEQFFSERLYSEFRVATPLEIKRAHTTTHRLLAHLISQLINEHKSETRQRYYG